MKKKSLITVLIVLLCLAGLVLLLQQCGHEDLTTFQMAEVSEITLEELLSPPYITVENWSFVDLWTAKCGGQSADASMAAKGSGGKIGQDLRELLNDVTLQTYTPNMKARNYDAHVKELLWEREDYHTSLQLTAGYDTGTALGDDDLLLSMLRLYILDDSKGYLTVSYRTGAEPESSAYIFTIDDPVTISDLVSFAAQIISRYPTEPDPTEPFQESNMAMPPSVFVEDQLYVSANYPSGYSEISKECVCLGQITECVGQTNVPEKNFQANYAPVGTNVYRYYGVILLEEEGKYYAYTAAEKTLDYFDYDDKVQVSYCQLVHEEETGNLEQQTTNLFFSEEEKFCLLELLDPYCSMTTTDNVLKMELSEYYTIEVDGKKSVMTISIDAEGGNDGQFYMTVMEHRPGAFLKAAYVDQDLVSFLNDSLAEEGA